MRKRQNSSFPLYQGTALAIAHITDAARFQTLCDRLLVAHWRYELYPRGASEYGTVKGQPDSQGYDPTGRLCAFQHGICTRTEWPGKLENDLKAVASLENFSPEIFVFCTNCSIDPEKERVWCAKVKSVYGWELRIIGVLELANALDTTQQGIRKDLLGIEIEHHNWESFLAACRQQRQMQRYRYKGKYDPALYVHREAEQKVRVWYSQMVISMQQGKPQARQLAIVDQAGAGKTNMVLHLAEEFGSKAPVIVIPGSVIIIDRHTLEREIVESVGYPIDDRTYHAQVHELCQLAQNEGFPFLVIIEGADENGEPAKLRIAIEYLWSVCQNYPLLLLVTCRDAFWPLIQSSLWKIQSVKRPSEGYVLPLRGYNEDEFRQACKLYFEKYNVNVQLGYEAGQRLRSPLLLSIFAEGNQNSSSRLILSIADKDLWRKYLEVKLDAVYEAIERSVPMQVIQAVIESIALQMVRENRSALRLDKLTNTHPLLNPYEASSRSLFLQLKNAAVLFEDASGRVKFVYETFLEFVVGISLSRTFEEAQEPADILMRLEELAKDYRWQRVPLYVAETVSQPATIIERLCVTNLWLAAEAIKRLQSLVPVDIQTRVVTHLEEKLSSRFTLDRQRAARFLGLLGTTGSKGALLRCWQSEKSETALCSLARLGVEEVVEPFIYYLGKRASWFLPENQELIDALSQVFRNRLIQTALAMLNDPEHAPDAAHTLGYLKYEQAIGPLFTYLVSTEYCDWVTLGALLHIQTEEAFDVVEKALSEIGKRLDLKDQQGITNRFGDNQEAAPTRNDLYNALDEIRVHGAQQCAMEKITPFLTRLLSHSNEYVRHMAVRSLGQLGASETLLAIIQSKQSETKRPTMGLMDTLLEFGTQIDVEPLIALANEPSTPEHVLHYVIRALGLSHDKRAIEIFKRFITNPQLLGSLVIALGNSALPEAVPLLARILDRKKVNLNGSGIKSKEMLDYMVVDSLGQLYHPSAFDVIEKFAQQKLPVVWDETISALAASGGEKAIPFLQKAWELDPKLQRGIIQALLWLGTNAAAEKIEELLSPYSLEKAVLLAKSLSRGRSLLLSGTRTRSSMVYDWADDQLIAILDRYVDEMSAEDKLTVIFALEYIAVPSAQRLLERIASDSHYDIPRPSSSNQTLRDVAVLILCDLGSEVAIDYLLDDLTEQSLASLEFFLSKLEQEQVRDALQQRLGSANGATLSKILTLLGVFGDHTVLPIITTYIDDTKIEVADAAYTAEQQILGMI
jgi:HEAT repeat protein